jgi:hypothetical protein
VRFSGKMQPGITLRDLVHAIPYFAIKEGLLTVAKQGKKNIFSGRILEIEGLEDLKCEQAFELSDASAEVRGDWRASGRQGDVVGSLRQTWGRVDGFTPMDSPRGDVSSPSRSGRRRGAPSS